MKTNKTKIPVKNIVVDVKTTQGDVIIGHLNINGHDRLSDFLKKDTSDFLKLSSASINYKAAGFAAIPKLNLAYILERCNYPGKSLRRKSKNAGSCPV